MKWSKSLCALSMALAVTGAGIGYSKANAAETTALTAETMIKNDTGSDTRLEIEGSGFEAAVEHITNVDYDNHRTMMGIRTPGLEGFEFRQTGVLDYGLDQETSGAFNTNVFFHTPKKTLRFGAGGGASFPEKNWLAHGNVQYEGNDLKAILGLLYDSSKGQMDVRGFASFMASPFYIGLGKPSGPVLINYMGIIDSKNEKFSAGAINRLNYETLASSHDAFLMWNPRCSRKGMDFQLNLETAADGLADFLFDPTIGWKPFLNKYGETNLAFSFRQDNKNFGASAMMSYNPGSKGNFLEIGSAYAKNGEDKDASATLRVGTDLGAIMLMASTTAEFTENEWNVLIYIGRTFEF